MSCPHEDLMRNHFNIELALVSVSHTTTLQPNRNHPSEVFLSDVDLNVRADLLHFGLCCSSIESAWMTAPVSGFSWTEEVEMEKVGKGTGLTGLEGGTGCYRKWRWGVTLIWKHLQELSWGCVSPDDVRQNKRDIHTNTLLYTIYLWKTKKVMVLHHQIYNNIWQKWF